MNQKKNLRFLVEGGIMIALATILSLTKIYEAPFGGSVTAGSMIPIIIIALRWGTLRGLFVGVVYGILQSIIDPYIVHPVQFLLDYPIAFGLLGLAGISKDIRKTDLNKISSGSEYALVIIGVLLGILGRFFGHLLAGVVFFAEYAGDLNPWWYSTLYNGSYLGIEFIISVFIIVLLWRPLKRI